MEASDPSRIIWVVVVVALLFLICMWLYKIKRVNILVNQDNAHHQHVCLRSTRTDLRRVYPAYAIQAQLTAGQMGWGDPDMQSVASRAWEQKTFPELTPYDPFLHNTESNVSVVQNSPDVSQQEDMSGQDAIQVLAGMHSPDTQELYVQIRMVRHRSAPPILVQSARGRVVDYIPSPNAPERRKSISSPGSRSNSTELRYVPDIAPVTEETSIASLNDTQNKNSSGESISAVVPLINR